VLSSKTGKKQEKYSTASTYLQARLVEEFFTSGNGSHPSFKAAAALFSPFAAM